MKKSRLLFVGVALAVAVSFGCGGKPKPDGLPKLTPCEITLKHGDAPAADVNVQLIADGGPGGWTVGGISDANGVVKIMTHGDFPGAPRGNYIVVLSKTEVEGFDPNAEVQTQPVSTYSLVAPKTTDQTTSELKITVGDSKTKETFDLGPEVRELIRVVNPGEF